MSTTETVIVYGPPACGKTRNAAAIAAAVGCSVVIDDWRCIDPTDRLVPGALHLTQQYPDDLAHLPKVRIIAFEDIDMLPRGVEVERPAQPAPPALPDGDYAIVEILGHRTLIGRVTEEERFGTKLLQVEPIYQGELLAPVMIGGASIYQFTPCTAEVAAKHAPAKAWQLPPSILATLPPAALPAPMDEGMPF